MEWNGWHQAAQQPSQRRSWREMFAPVAIRRNAGQLRGLTLESTRFWFPDVTGRYALSFSPLDGADIVDSEPYRLWLIPGEHRIYFLRSPSRTSAP